MEKIQLLKLGTTGDSSKPRSSVMKTLNSDLQKIEEFIQLNGKVLLEVGCGNGQLTALLVDKAAAITAIDPGGSSIEAARKQVNILLIGNQ